MVHVDEGMCGLLAAVVRRALSDLTVKSVTPQERRDAFEFALDLGEAMKERYNGRTPDKIKEALSNMDLSELAVQTQRDVIEKRLRGHAPDDVEKALTAYDDQIADMRTRRDAEVNRSATLLRERYRLAHARAGGDPEAFDTWFLVNKDTLVLSEAISAADAVDERRAQFSTWVRNL